MFCGRRIEMRKTSVKLKITLWYVLVMTIVSLTVFILMNSINIKSIEQSMSERLTKTVDMFARRITDNRGDTKRIQNFEYFKDGVSMAIYDSQGRLVGGQAPFGISDGFEFIDGDVRQTEYNSDKYYEYDKVVGMTDGRIVRIKGLISEDNERAAADSAAKRNMVFIIIMIIIAGAGGYVVTLRTLEPVRKIQETAKSIIKNKDLKQRINIGSGGDEFHTLANTFDEMLDEIENLVEHEMQFTSDASHELRTPVAVIMSECDYMTKYAASVDEFKESAESVKNQTERMSKLISELLSISRMDKNTQKLTFEETNLTELVEFICNEQRQINESDITMETDIAPDISAEADRFMLSRLFINLISNAYKYNTEKGRIRVTLSEAQDKIIFSVADTGIGIAKENIPKIWERFYRADESRTSDDSGSMGLGLSMVKWIAEKHGGEVSVKSELGVGSEFKFTFPKHRD